MDCLKCGGKTKTIDSRPFAGTRYRKRKCLECNNQFWTVEDEADPNEVRDMLDYLKMNFRDRKRGKE